MMGHPDGASRRRRMMLYGAAMLFFAYEQVAFYQWMQAHGTVAAGLAHAWSTLRADPMVFMAWNDMGVFTAVVLVWLARDLTARKRSLLWWPATLLLGCPPLLIYLARYGGAHSATESGASLRDGGR